METIFGVIALCIGTVAALAAAINTWRAYRAESWPIAMGKVTLSRTRETRRKNRIVLVAEIGYSYDIGSTTFTGGTVRFLQPECDSDMAISVTHKYPLGREVEVHYMPKSPEVSCLEAGVYSISLVAIPIGIIVMALGAYLIQK